MKPLFKLRAHTASILCCITSSTSRDSVFSSSEDGSVRVFDLRTQNCVTALQISGETAVASICLRPGDDNQLYAAAGNVVMSFDLRLGSSGREQQKYDFSTDEINQVVLNQKATYLAAADDSGEIKVIDLVSHKLYKTLRGVHTNICSAVQFHPQRPWEAMSGGLDSKIVKWDFSRGRQLRIIEPGKWIFQFVCKTVEDNESVASGNNIRQVYNPPSVHALATSYGDCSGEMGRALAVARGDGTVEVYDFDMGKPTRVKSSKSGKSKSSSEEGEGDEHYLKCGLKRRLTADNGGHLSAVSSVTFARFGERGRYLLSGGNDGLIKLWDWVASSFRDSLIVDDTPMSLNIRHRKKINWLSTKEDSSANLLVADTSKVLSLYHVI